MLATSHLVTQKSEEAESTHGAQIKPVKFYQRPYSVKKPTSSAVEGIFERFSRMEANINRLSAELQHDGFRKEWFPGEDSALDQAVRDWEAAGYEVRRFPLEEERFAKSMDTKVSTDPLRTPVYVRRIVRPKV